MNSSLVILLIAGQGFGWGFLAGRNNCRAMNRLNRELQTELGRLRRGIR